MYSAPAVNILAIILTARVLGFKLGVGRIVGSVSFSVIIGLTKAFVDRKEERANEQEQFALAEEEERRPLWQTAVHFFILVAILVFANRSDSGTTKTAWYAVYSHKWFITGFFGIAYALSLIFILKLNKVHVLAVSAVVILASEFWGTNPLIPFTVAVGATVLSLSPSDTEAGDWMRESWAFAKQILPLLASSVIVHDRSPGPLQSLKSSLPGLPLREVLAALGQAPEVPLRTTTYSTFRPSREIAVSMRDPGLPSSESPPFKVTRKRTGR